MFIDYLKFTWEIPKGVQPDPSNPKQAIDLFLDEFPELVNYMIEASLAQKGVCYYDQTIYFTDSVRISYCLPNSPNFFRMNLHVDIPSHGLEKFCNCFNLNNKGVELFKLLRNRHCKVTRLDITQDDFTRTFSPLFYFQCYDPENNNGFDIRTHYKTCQLWPDYSTTVSREEPKQPASTIISHVTETAGATFTIGRRSVGKMLRIYDKFEQAKKVYGKQYVEDHPELFNCIRYEFELRHEFAEKFVDQCIEHNSLPSFEGQFRSFMEVIVLDDSNSSRCSIYTTWLNFLRSQKDNFNEEFIPKYTKEQKIANTFRWIEECCLRQLRLYSIVHGDDYMLWMIHNAELPDDTKGLLPFE